MADTDKSTAADARCITCKQRLDAEQRLKAEVTRDMEALLSAVYHPADPGQEGDASLLLRGLIPRLTVDVFANTQQGRDLWIELTDWVKDHAPELGAAVRDIAEDIIERDGLRGPRVIHVLWAGVAICGTVQGAPVGWPSGHVWVPVDERGLATCAECCRLAAERDGHA